MRRHKQVDDRSTQHASSENPQWHTVCSKPHSCLLVFLSGVLAPSLCIHVFGPYATMLASTYVPQCRTQYHSDLAFLFIRQTVL